MRLSEVLDAIEARTSYRFGSNGDRQNMGHTLTRELARLSGRIIGNAPTGRPAGRPGAIAYDAHEVERTVLWLRMRAMFGPIQAKYANPRRAAQDAIPRQHQPGWVCVSMGKAWFQETPPVDAITSGDGLIAIKVHDDCECGR